MEKTTRTAEDVVAEAGQDMTKLHACLLEAMSPVPVVVWEGKFWGGTDQTIIGYGEHTYPRSDGRTVEWFYLGLAAQKHGYSVYANGVSDGEYLTQRFKGRVGKAKVGKAAISFADAQSVDLEALTELAKLTKESFE